MKNHFNISTIENLGVLELTHQEVLEIDGGDARLFGEFCGALVGAVVCVAGHVSKAIVEGLLTR